MKGREGCWDAPGVAADLSQRGSPPGTFSTFTMWTRGIPTTRIQLGDARSAGPYLMGEDPTRIVARSDSPLLTAVFPWEQCPVKNSTCQETMVVFSTGLKPLGNDEFLVVYGGGDTDVGLAKIKVRSKTFDVSS